MNGKPMASTSSGTAALEDHIVRERTKQIILQSMSFKTSLKVNCIMAVEVDEEPTRCVILNEVFSSADRARFVAQAPIPFLSLDPATYISTENNGYFPKVNHYNTPIAASSSEYISSLSHVKSEPDKKQGRKNPMFSSTPSKRKAGKPCRIPPAGHYVKEETNGVLDLSKTDSILTNGGANMDDTIESYPTAVSLRNMLGARQKLNDGDIFNQQDPISLGVANSLEGSSFNQYSEDVKMESSNVGYGDKITDAHFTSMSMPVFPPVKVHYNPISKPKKKVTSGLGGVITKRSGSSKVFACNQCKEHFNSLTSLCKHTFSVHRAFRCTFCGANFTQRSNLQRHSLKHVGFKPFICNVCTKAYYRKDHLVRHIEVTHPEVEPKASITVKLTSSECLEYLEKMQKEEGSSIAAQGLPAESNQLDQLISPESLDCLDMKMQDDDSITPTVTGSPTQSDSATDAISESTRNVSTNQLLLGLIPNDNEMFGDIDQSNCEIIQPDEPVDSASVNDAEEDISCPNDGINNLESSDTLKEIKTENVVST